MNKITNSSYNAYSSGLSSFLNQSTSDTSAFSQSVPVHMTIDALDNGRYAQAWCYALNDYRLIDTVFEAWVHGPVSPALYDKFKSFGYNSIRLAGKYTVNIAEADIELLESVWETYGDHTGNALEALSHSEPPWIEARVRYAPNERCNVPISVESMKKYYSSIYLGGDS